MVLGSNVNDSTTARTPFQNRWEGAEGDHPVLVDPKVVDEVRTDYST